MLEFSKHVVLSFRIQVIKIFPGLLLLLLTCCVLAEGNDRDSRLQEAEWIKWIENFEKSCHPPLKGHGREVLQAYWSITDNIDWDSLNADGKSLLQANALVKARKIVRKNLAVKPGGENLKPQFETLKDRFLYMTIPLKGSFGHANTQGSQIFVEGVQKALKHAKKRGCTHIIFYIDSPGGDLREAIEIQKLMLKTPQFHYSIRVKKAISASIWIVFACATIIVDADASIGSAVVYLKNSTTGVVEVDAKMNSFYSAQINSIAENFGYPKELIAAMVVMKATAYGWLNDLGEVMISVDPPAEHVSSDQIIFADTNETVLTLTDQQLIRLGIAEPYDPLSFPPHTEGKPPVKFEGKQYMERAQTRAKKLLRKSERLAANLIHTRQKAINNDPRSAGYTYYLDTTGKLTKTSQKIWQRQTNLSIAAWNDTIVTIKSLNEISEKHRYEVLNANESSLRSFYDEANLEINRLNRERNRE